MFKLFSIAILLVTINHAAAQIGFQGSAGAQYTQQDTLSEIQRRSTSIKDIKNKKAKFKDYQIISYTRDTTYVDTTLSIKKEYAFNYLRRDNFGLMPFSNLGQTYNRLTYDFKSTDMMPSIGAQARHFNYMTLEDIDYYHVPTPLTELFFKTGFEQGQLIDAFFTVNPSPRFNFSVAYKGLRSLGNYQHLLTSTGNFRATTNYTNKRNNYNLRAHFVTQDLMNQENGGLRDEFVDFFEQGDEEYLDRSILEVNFENAESLLKGKRLYLNHEYHIIKAHDSLSKNKLSLEHTLVFKDKSFLYDQTAAETTLFGTADNPVIRDKSSLEDFYNELQVNFSNNILGQLKFNASYRNYNYGYNKLVRLADETLITNRIKGSILALGGAYNKRFKHFELNATLGTHIYGDFNAQFLNTQARFKLNEDFSATAELNYNSKAPNYNTLLHHSNYINYRWKNEFNNTKTQQLALQLQYKNWANITIDYNRIEDYVYFAQDTETSTTRPFQTATTIPYLRVKLANDLKFGKFALNNTVLYQNVTSNTQVLNVPQLTTRNTLYYASHVFKKAMYLQTGLTVNYFTKYFMAAYDPVLAEFYVQRDREFGNFPRLDFFFNTKIRQTRIFFKAEHFDTIFRKVYDYYAAPNHPYRDFKLRFGIVWNFFL